MKIEYRAVKLSKANKERLITINDIIEDYQQQGYRLTLRQLYYQLVTKNIVPNQAKEYSKLSVLLREGRMAGIVDWDAIEDRLRVPDCPSAWESPAQIVKHAMLGYRKDRLAGQENYIEVWVEKDALSGVLKRVTEPYHVPIMVNRGYSSASAMHDAFERFQEAATNPGNNQKVTVLYLGDFDPSGIDMIRDIKDRISEFDIHDDVDFDIKPIALTKAQIRKYNPPPNPAKIKDPRSGGYIAEHGRQSWEVDALRPDVLNELLESEILKLIDIDQYNNVLDEEKSDKAKLRTLLTKL